MGYLPYKTNKSKMGCGNREEREREREREREGGEGKSKIFFFFTEILGNKLRNKNLMRLPVPRNVVNIVNILYSPYHDPLHRPVQQTHYPINFDEVNCTILVSHCTW